MQFTKKTVKTAVQIDATSGKDSRIYFFHFNQYNRCKTYTRCEKGSGVDQFYKKEYIRLIFAKKRLQQLEKVAEEVKFRRENKKLQENTTGWKK